MTWRIVPIVLASVCTSLAPAAAPQAAEWPKLQHTLKGWSGGLAFSPDSKTLYAGGWDPDQPPPDRSRVPDRVISVWDVATGKQAAMLKGHKEARTVALSPDGKLVASAGKGLQLWDVATGKSIRSIEGPRGQVQHLVFSPDGKLLASGAIHNGGVGSAVGVWEVDTLKESPGSPKDVIGVNSLAFSPDGKILAFNLGGEILLWEVTTGRERARIKPEGMYIKPHMAFSPDGKTLAVGVTYDVPKEVPKLAVPPGPKGDPRQVTLWDIATGQLTSKLDGHVAFVYSVAYSSDGKLLASSSRDGTVRLWDVASKKSIATLETKPWMNQVAFSPDGKVLATASHGGEAGSGERVIKLWSLEREK